MRGITVGSRTCNRFAVIASMPVSPITRLTFGLTFGRFSAVRYGMVSLLTAQCVAVALMAVRVHQSVFGVWSALVIVVNTVATMAAIGVIADNALVCYVTCLANFGHFSFLMCCSAEWKASKTVSVVITMSTAVVLLVHGIGLSVGALKRRPQNRLPKETAKMRLPIQTISGNCSMPYALRAGYEQYSCNKCVATKSDSCRIITSDWIQFRDNAIDIER